MNVCSLTLAVTNSRQATDVNPTVTRPVLTPIVTASSLSSTSTLVGEYIAPGIGESVGTLSSDPTQASPTAKSTFTTSRTPGTTVSLLSSTSVSLGTQPRKPSSVSTSTSRHSTPSTTRRSNGVSLTPSSVRQTTSRAALLSHTSANSSTPSLPSSFLFNLTGEQAYCQSS